MEIMRKQRNSKCCFAIDKRFWIDDGIIIAHAGWEMFKIEQVWFRLETFIIRNDRKGQ